MLCIHGLYNIIWPFEPIHKPFMSNIPLKLKLEACLRQLEFGM